MRRARYFAVAVAIVLAGCGGDDDPKLNAAEIAKELAGDVEEQTGTRNVLVVCKGDVGEGDLCRVGAPGGLKAEIRITRLEGDDVDGEIVQP